MQRNATPFVASPQRRRGVRAARGPPPCIGQRLTWDFQSLTGEFYAPLRNAQRVDFSPLTWPFVEVTGFEPASSTLRKSGSQCFDQVLSEGSPGSTVAIPSGHLTIHPLSSR
jgi:hypothetical protein